MANVSYKLKDLEKRTIKIGYVGENDHMHVLIDCKEAFDEYPNAVVTMAIVPPEGEDYPKAVTRTGNIVEWLVKNSDVAAEGDGEFQLTFTEDNVVKKSVTGRFSVERSISGNGTAPSGIDDWLTDANEKLAEVEAATQEAEDAASHAPRVGTSGYWEVWDAEQGQYVATSTKAQGEPGEPGSPGDPTQMIDDQAGQGVTGKTWSADKLTDELGDVLNAIDGIIEYKNDALPFFQGGLNGTSGLDYSEAATAYAKTDFIRNVSKVTAISGYTLKIFYYTEQRSFISRESISDREWNIEDAPSNMAYIRVQIERSKGVDIGNIHNIVSVYQTDKTYKEAVKSIEECNPVGVREYSYKGEKITITHKLSSEIFGSKIGISSCQDGVIIGNEMILFNDDGDFVSIDCTTKAKIGGGKLEEVITGVYPHANSASVGSEANGAGYKYIYVNAYNNAGLPKGTCYVYSISKSGETYTASIVQTISIGFVTETIWDDGASVRPYGNFVVDVDNNALYASLCGSSSGPHIP